jgi:hypothetical protein
MPQNRNGQSEDDCHHSEKRLQELEVIYTSALEEIKWVLGNYPLDKSKRWVEENVQETVSRVNY